MADQEQIFDLLINTIQLKDLSTVRQLTDKHPEWINQQNVENTATALHAAALIGDVDICKHLINSGANCNGQVENGATALHVSAQAGFTDVCRFLIESKANIDIKTKEGYTPLYAGAESGHCDVCKLLIESGANKDIQAKNGATALYISASKGYADVCKLLIESKANIDIPDNSITTALYVSAQNGMTDVCRLLIKAGANPDIQADNNTTALYVSAKSGYTDICKLLIEYGAKKDLQTDNGSTALFASAECGYTEICRILIDSGAKKDTKMNEGATALFLSAQNGHTDICKLLIEAGANKDIQTNEGGTALFTSIQNGYLDIATLLIESGANKDIHTRSGMTALMAAAYLKKYYFVKLLVDNNADMDKSDVYGETALHKAANFGDAPVVKLLLEKHASVRQSKNGNTPLHGCLLNKDLGYDHHLMVSVAFMGTDPSIATIRNKEGKSPIDLYEENECKKYRRESRSEQRKKVLLLLKGGPIPAVDFGPPAPPPQGPVRKRREVQGSSGMSEEDFIHLTAVVSKWYDDRNFITMLKVLFRDHINRAKLSTSSHTKDLLEELIICKHLGPDKLDLLYNTIKITKHFHLIDVIREKLPSFPDVKEIPISQFTDHRQRLIDFGNELTANDVFAIDSLFNRFNKCYGDSWCMITDLEDLSMIQKNKMEEFCTRLKDGDICTRIINVLGGTTY